MDWLNTLTESSMRSGPFPLHHILQNSLYYPASGTDGTPVRHWNLGVISFVYSDFSVSKETLELAESFTGYHILGTRDVLQHELTPNGIHTHEMPTCICNQHAYIEIIERSGITPSNAFALWTVFERNEELDQRHGPHRFSLLFIRGEGVSTYQSVYSGNGVCPKIIALIRPGEGFGGNYQGFSRALLDTFTRSGRLPEKFLFWHFRFEHEQSIMSSAGEFARYYDMKSRILGPLGKDHENDSSVSLYARLGI